MLGAFMPELGVQMKPLGDLFISIVKLLVGPVIFFTVTSGIATMGSIRQMSRIGIKALVYFEVLSVLALLAGFAAAALLQPGAGFPIDASPGASVPPSDLSLLRTLGNAFLDSWVLQVLTAAILSGVSLALLGERARRFSAGCERIAGWLFGIVGLIMTAAPVAAFGAIAFTVGKYGITSVAPLLQLLGVLYLATIVFVLAVLGAIARLAGFRILRFIWYIREELMIVFGTASSITAMPRLIEKLEQAGCTKTVARIAVPAGYSFNLNGSNIYIAVALLFLAQAYGIELGPASLLTILAVAMITTKGASGVAGSAFIALAATLAAVPALPDGSLMFIVGIERLLKCRSLGNIIGNGVACLAISAWDGTLDRTKLRDAGIG
jgi:aerobic C4-dicarboxylate transport protein